MIKKLVSKKFIIIFTVVGTVIVTSTLGVLGTHFLLLLKIKTVIVTSTLGVLGGLGYFSPSTSTSYQEKEKFVNTQQIISDLKVAMKNSYFQSTTLKNDKAVLTTISTINGNQNKTRVKSE